MKDWVHIQPCNTFEVFPLQDLFEAQRAGIFFKILALIPRGGAPWGGSGNHHSDQERGNKPRIIVE
jgi:hypothetical protein